MKRTAVKRVAKDTDSFRVSMSLVDESVRRDFGRHLGVLMARHNPPMSQSDLARVVFGTVDGTASGFAKGRDLVSKYLRGITFPNNNTLSEIANALGVSKTEVLPPLYRAQLEKGVKPNGVSSSGDNDGTAILRIEGKLLEQDAVRIFAEYLTAESRFKASAEGQSSRKR